MTQARRGSTAAWIGIGAIAALGLGLWLWERGAIPEPEALPSPEAGGVPEPVVATPGRVATLDPGGTLVVPKAALPASGSLGIELRFPLPSADTAPRPGRVLAPDGRVLDLQAPVAGADRHSVTVEIPAHWLSPGRYVVEIQTTERTHFPLRRYAIEVE